MLSNRGKVMVVCIVMLSSVMKSDCQAVWSCDDKDQAISPQEIPGVPMRYWFLYEDNWPYDTKEKEAARDGLPFDEISLTRGGMLQPSYAITLRRDGTANYDGVHNIKRKGRYAGAVELMRYGRLCYLMERMKLEEMSPNIRLDKSHGSSARGVTIGVRRVGESEFSYITEINGSGPIELWAIQLVIDGIAAEIEWKQNDAMPSKNGNGG